MSGGRLLALTADEIVMDPHAVLGPVDPQIGDMPASSIVKLLALKPPAQISDEMLVLADVAQKARVQVATFVAQVLLKHLPRERAAALAAALSEGRAAPKEVMEALFVHLMQWGKQQGYRWFMLGMAPLSGFEQSPVAPVWNRIGAFLYEHGESVYHFQGLRTYKEKFNPIWEQHYLAYPGGPRLPR